MVARIGRYRRTAIDGLVLVELFFLEESKWIALPADWRRSNRKGQAYNSEVGEGARIWSQAQLALLLREHAVAGAELV
jgi:type 1 glutamine amidotransferase